MLHMAGLLGAVVFRSIWIATVVSNIGTWMQSVGIGRMMTSLTPSQLLVAYLMAAGCPDRIPSLGEDANSGHLPARYQVLGFP